MTTTTTIPTNIDDDDDDDDDDFSSNQNRNNDDNDRERITTTSIAGFLKFFFNSKGALPLLIITTLLSLGIASTIGVVPDVVSDRYARIHHGYNDTDHDCHSFDRSNKPDACQRGFDDAQAMAAYSDGIKNTAAVICSPVIGSMSDIHGRRRIIIGTLFLQILIPLALVVLQLVDTMDPVWFYASYCLGGSLNYYFSIVFAAVADIFTTMTAVTITTTTTNNNKNDDDNLKSPTLALIMAGFHGGFALGPSITVFVDHLYTSIFSFLLILSAFLMALTALPETLPGKQQQQQQQHQQEEPYSSRYDYYFRQIIQILSRPFREITILNRNWMIRLLSIGSFLQAMVYSADSSLIMYYMEDQLDVRDNDIAGMFLCCGLLGIIVHGFLLQPLLRFLEQGKQNLAAITAADNDNNDDGTIENNRSFVLGVDENSSSAGCGGGGSSSTTFSGNNNMKSEKVLLVLTFISGTIHNFLYGIADLVPHYSKTIIYVALSVSEFTLLNVPILSSLASKAVVVAEDCDSTTNTTTSVINTNCHSATNNNHSTIIAATSGNDDNDDNKGLYHFKTMVDDEKGLQVMDGDIGSDRDYLCEHDDSPTVPLLLETRTAPTTNDEQEYADNNGHNNIGSSIIINSDDDNNNSRNNIINNDKGGGEQGRVQGALFAINSLAHAIGPVSAEFIYNLTKDGNSSNSHHHSYWWNWGPGTMFLYLALLYMIGTAIVSVIPLQRQGEKQQRQQQQQQQQQH